MSSTIQRGLPSGDTPARPPDYEDSPGVRETLTAVDDGRPVVLITGRAGTGKTTLVHHLRERAGGEAQAVVAPTGVAALNARAQTIHSFFQFPFGVLDPQRLRPNRNAGKLYKRMQRLVIDEISMVRADILDSIDAKLRQARGDARPFGGVQIVLVGDFLQLPPVVERGDLPILEALGYPSPFAFSARVLSEITIETIELDQ